MRELCVEEIAMSTRVALPMFLGCRMSELRRQLLPSPTPNQDRTAQVRKNLFGPIDHDENLKFVHDELNKISEADSKRWNFDFQSEKPKDGRYNWEPVGEGVPQAYEMPRLTYLTTHSSLAAPKPLHKVPEGVSGCTSASASTVVDHQQPSTSTQTTTTTPSPTTTTTTTVLDKPTTTTTSKTTTAKSRLPLPTTTISSASSSEDPASKSNSEVVVVKKCTTRSSSSSSDEVTVETRQHKSTPPTVRSTRSKAAQPPVTALFKIRKPKRTANTKLEEEMELPALKRPKTTTS